MKVLALDQSTTCSGYAVFIDGKYDHSGVVDLHLIKETNVRFKRMYEELYKLVEDEKPDRVVIEDTQAQGGNMAVFKLLCQLQGILIGVFYAKGIQFTVMTPSHWRNILGYAQGPKVKRAELKQQSKDYAKEHFGLTGKEDMLEAACIGDAYCIEHIDDIKVHKNIADDGIDI